jgi:hypothetical protein
MEDEMSKNDEGRSEERPTSDVFPTYPTREHSKNEMGGDPLYRVMRKVPELADALNAAGGLLDQRLAERNQSFIFETPLSDDSLECEIEIHKRRVALGEALLRSDFRLGQGSTRALRREYEKIIGESKPTIAQEWQRAYYVRKRHAQKSGERAMRKFEQWVNERGLWVMRDVATGRSVYYEPPTPEDVVLGVEGDDRFAELVAVLAVLPPAERRAFVRRLHGLPSSGPAEDRACSRARGKLRAALEVQQEALKNP